MSERRPGAEIRRFACTACGRCCDRGPEMELSEAAALADVFVASLLFKVHSVPLDARSDRAVERWRRQGSRIPQRSAFEEERRQLALFASRRRSDRRRGRETYLTLSAIVDDYGGGRCPALADRLCGIHDRRPLTCRTVPLHYSRQPSVLGAYLDRFTATPGYACDTVDGPIILDGNRVTDDTIRQDRERAGDVAKADRRWKEALLAIMDDPQAAVRAGLPTYKAVLDNSDNGFATMLPMIAAWRVAVSVGLLSQQAFSELCARQVALIETEAVRLPSAQGLRELLPLYRTGAAGCSVESQ